MLADELRTIVKRMASDQEKLHQYQKRARKQVSRKNDMGMGKEKT